MDSGIFFECLGTFQFQKGVDCLKRIQSSLEKNENSDWINYYNKLIQAEQFYYDLQINEKIGVRRRRRILKF
jgi:hypothetical protein